MKDWQKNLIVAAALVACTNVWAGDIHRYATIGNVAKLKELLANNPELVNENDPSFGTPLHGAAIAGKTEAAVFLVANKADVNARFGKSRITPLHWARNKEIALLLLAHGAGVNAKTSEGSTPLFSAVSLGSVEVVETLLANKADVNAVTAGGSTALDLATNYPRLQKMAELLRKHGGKKGPGGIHQAVASGNMSEVKELLSSYPESVNDKYRGTKEGGSPVQVAVIFRHKEILELLLAHKADINFRDNLGRTALFLAAYSNNEEGAKILLANKADVNIKDNDGRRPLDVASDKIAALLRAHGAKSGRE
jgi:ankyrin repeat protein